MLLLKNSGNWKLLEAPQLDELVQFLDEQQVYLNNLGSRAGNPASFLKTSEWRILLRQGPDQHMDAVFAINKRGFSSVHARYPELAAAEAGAAARLVGGWANFVHTIMGNTESVDAILPALGLKIDARIEYEMMLLGSRLSGPTKPKTAPSQTFNGDFLVSRTRSEDIRKIFPLQLAYEKEEVQLAGRSIDPVLTRMHLERNLREQIAVHGTYRGKIVTKAMTNARGSWVDQVGGVYTLPQYRGSGFARLAMVSLIDLINAGGRSVSLFVKKHNAAALSLYRGLGFSAYGSFSIAYFL